MDPLSWLDILGRLFVQLLPVWVALVALFAVSITFKRRLGLYGKLFDSTVGMIGFALVMFWVFAALFANMILTHDPLAQFSGMRNVAPGMPLRDPAGGYEYFLLGGDALARDVFSRMVVGAREVLRIAPFAAMISFMIGISLGLPAGYIGGKEEQHPASCLLGHHLARWHQAIRGGRGDMCRARTDQDSAYCW